MERKLGQAAEAGQTRRVALYARVSSERQAEKDLSIPAQLGLVKEWAAKRGHSVVREYCDRAKSGRTDKRTQFQQMIADAKRKPCPFDLILCWKSSRFTRNREDAVVYKALLRRLGIDVVSISEPFDDSPTGRLLEGVIEVIDEFYSRQLSQEVIRGMTEAARQGRWPGAKPPYGYKLTPTAMNGRTCNTLGVDEQAAAAIRAIFELAVFGHSLGQIGREIRAQAGGSWSRKRVYDILTHPVYTGAFVWNRRDTSTNRLRPQDEWIFIPDHHERIISGEQFRQVQTILESRNPARIHPRVAGSRRLLSGLLWCYCGAQFGVVTGRGHGGEYHYYSCNARAKRESCTAPRLSGARTEKAVVGVLCERVFTDRSIDRMLSLVNEELAVLTEGAADRVQQLALRLAKAEQGRQRLLDLLESGDPNFSASTIGDRLAALTNQVFRLRREVAEAEQRAKVPTGIEIGRSALREFVKDTVGLLRRADPTELKALLSQVVEKIRVSRSGKLTVFARLPQSGLSLLSSNGRPCRDRTCDLWIERRSGWARLTAPTYR